MLVTQCCCVRGSGFKVKFKGGLACQCSHQSYHMEDKPEGFCSHCNIKIIPHWRSLILVLWIPHIWHTSDMRKDWMPLPAFISASSLSQHSHPFCLIFTFCGCTFHKDLFFSSPSMSVKQLQERQNNLLERVCSPHIEQWYRMNCLLQTVWDCKVHSEEV